MQFRTIFVALSLTMATVASAAPVKEAKAVLAEITAYHAAQVKEMRAANKHIDNNAIAAGEKQIALEAVKELDPMTLDASTAIDWAHVYLTANKPAEAVTLAKKYLGTNPSKEDKASAEDVLMEATYDLGDSAALTALVHNATISSSDQALGFGLGVAYEYATLVAAKEGPEAGVAMIDDLLARFPKASEYAKDDLDSFYLVRDGLLGSKAEILAEAGKRTEALKLLDDAKASADPKSTDSKRLDGERNKVAVVGVKAPALPAETTFGTYSGLDSLKGKVVIVDFFAHWCGPCRMAFPETREMYAELKDKGLEVIGYTSYQGYYKSEKIKERDMPKATELAHMGEFVKEQNMTWPVVIGPKDASKAYGVSSIPHLVVIDKHGIVRRVRVGYDEQSEKDLRAFIEKLLAED